MGILASELLEVTSQLACCLLQKLLPLYFLTDVTLATKDSGTNSRWCPKFHTHESCANSPHKKYTFSPTGRIHFSHISKSGNSDRFYFLGFENHCGQWLQPRDEKTLAPWKENYDKPRQHIQKQRHHFSDKGPYSQTYCFPISHVWMWELDHKEGWAPRSWCFWIVVLEKTLESPLDYKIKPANPKGNQPVKLNGRTDTKTPILWLPDEKSRVIGKDPDAAKDWEQEHRGWDGWMTITDLMGLSLSKLPEVVKDRKPDVLQSMGLQRFRHDLATQQQLQGHLGVWPRC